MEMDFNNHKAGFVNILGKPNVGKSTLMNELVGEKLAIITSKAQTTRHRIFGIVNGQDFQIVYSDTPGIIEDPAYKLQENMMSFVKSSLRDADLLLIVVEFGEKDVTAYWDKIKHNPAPKIFIINKIDLAENQDAIDAKIAYWKEKVDADLFIPVSALHKKNLNLLFEKIVELLPFHPPFYDKDTLTDKPERFFISEIIREKIFLNYKQEIPYSTEVYIDAFQETDDINKIRAIIFCNRKSQKPIIIGKGGEMLKKVGSQARKDIENFTDKKCYLELFVKVRENWRTDDFTLKQLGY